MSKIALEGNSLGTGTFTIAAPNSNSSPTLTLPTSSGTMVVTGGAQTIEFGAGSASTPSITFTGDTNTGEFSPGADTIAWTTGGSERVRVDSSGNVGIGDTSPSTTRLSAFSGGAGTAGQLKLGYDGTAYWQIGRLDPAGTGSGNFQFKPNGGTTVFDITTGGTVILSGGNLAATGTGITFPATQSASTDANTLDDYEEGAWTPTVYGQTTAGTTTYTAQTGSYVKVGKSVTLVGRVAYSAATGTGNWIMGGLPFAPISSLNITGSIMSDGLNWTGGTMITLFIATDSTMQIYGSSDDGALSRQSMTNEAVDLYFSATYITNT